MFYVKRVNRGDNIMKKILILLVISLFLLSPIGTKSSYAGKAEDVCKGACDEGYSSCESECDGGNSNCDDACDAGKSTCEAAC